MPNPFMPAMPLLKLSRGNDLEDVRITTGSLDHLIKSFCGDGYQRRIKIFLTHEQEPLETAGALDLLRKNLDSTFFLLKGEILANLNYIAFTTCYRDNGGVLTIATTS